MCSYVSVKQRPVVLAMIKTIFAQETRDAGHTQWDIVQQHFVKQWPKLAAAMGTSKHQVLAFMDFPKSTGVRSIRPILLSV